MPKRKQQSEAKVSEFAKAKRAAKLADQQQQQQQWENVTGPISLGALLSEQAPTLEFKFWIIGDTPLISHAWSEKARQEMLKTQSGATRSAKEKRDPEQDFINSLYEFGDGSGVYGFPVTAVKNAIIDCAHKDRGIARSDVQSALWLDAEMIKTKTAYPKAKCNLPLVRIFGDKPMMREDMVRVGVGLRKTANLCYRGEFTNWAVRISGSVNPLMVPPHALAFLIRSAGSSVGIGDWRNERKGWFGSFHLGDAAEEAAWDKFAAGRGPLPKSRSKKQHPTSDLAIAAE